MTGAMVDYFPWVIGGMLAFSGTIIAYVYIPLIMQFLGVSPVFYRKWHGAGEEVFLSDDDPIPPELFTQLAALGFQPAGMLVRLHWFTGPFFLDVQRRRIFISGDGTCLASIFRFSHGEEPRVALETIFDDRAVDTLNFSARITERPTYICQYEVTGDLDALLRKHHEAVQRIGTVDRIKTHRTKQKKKKTYRAIGRGYRISRTAPLFYVWRYLPAFGVGLIVWFLFKETLADTFADPLPFQVAIASLPTAGGVLILRRDLLLRIPAQRAWEVAEAQKSPRPPES